MKTPAPSTFVPLVKNKNALKKRFNRLPAGIRPHFSYFLGLLDSKFPLEVTLAYLFTRVELAHRDTLYCGIVRKHHAVAKLVSSVIRRQRITRDGFLQFFENLMGSQLPPVILSKLKTAERIRDKAIHGSRPTDAELRNAIKDVLDYSEDYDSHVKRLAGFCPFGDLRGILSGRAWRLDRPTTKLVLKGLGFKVS